MVQHLYGLEVGHHQLLSCYVDHHMFRAPETKSNIENGVRKSYYGNKSKNYLHILDWIELTHTEIGDVSQHIPIYKMSFLYILDTLDDFLLAQSEFKFCKIDFLHCMC